MAFLDACAVVADILKFSRAHRQRRLSEHRESAPIVARAGALWIAMTSTRRRGQCHLAFTVEDAPGRAGMPRPAVHT